MKVLALILFFWLTLWDVNGQTASFQSFMNPVIPGDHPDCTLTKVGNDFYTTGSSFNPTPVIYHSTDLVHWEAIAQPVSAAWSNYGDAPGGGCWGGHLVFYNGKYWDFFGRAFIMYYVKADNPKGPWSEPVRVNNPTTISYGLGADNSIFIDDNNKWYLVVKNGQPNNGIVELGNSGQPTGVVYDLKWLNPGPSYPYSWAEGPVMWKYKGYYYYSFARDVGGGQKVMRSKTLTADQSAWEVLGDFFNENDPLKASSLFTGPNHASPVMMIGDSTSWVMHPVYAKGEWKGQGRQGLLNQVRYNSNNRPVADYPVNQPFVAPKLSGCGIPWMVPKSDYFTSSTLHPEWSFLGYTPAGKFSLSERPGWLRLSPKSSAKANTVIKNDGEHNYSLITRLDFNPKSPEDEAGLRIIRGDEVQFVKLFTSCNVSGNKVIVFSFGTSRFEVENRTGDTLWLKMIRINHKINGYFSDDGRNWTPVGQTVDISTIDSYSDFSTWAGTRQGLYVQGTANAWFDLYIYRDAFTPLLAECPANQSGTGKTSTSEGFSVLDNIHPNDWALYAGVEFGNKVYYGMADSVEFTASCAAAGGSVEIWLDSIGSGTKMAECKINTTGSWNEFRRFTAPVAPVTGNHDVYLKFTGSGTSKLFQLKWITFIRKTDLLHSSFSIRQSGTLSVFPNPAQRHFSIHSGFSFHTTEIFDMSGQRVFFFRKSESEQGSFDIHLAKGLYLLKIRSNSNFACSKLMID
jgi:xylan 1,4-beta-xylosidase